MTMTTIAEVLDKYAHVAQEGAADRPFLGYLSLFASFLEEIEPLLTGTSKTAVGTQGIRLTTYVQSLNHPDKSYLVSWLQDPDGYQHDWTCECPDYLYRGGRCKHIRPLAG